LNEYHVVVAEVIGGMSADLTEHTNRIAELESKIESLTSIVEALQEANKVLVRQILSLQKYQTVQGEP
jgi:hypothetical protein